MIAIVGGMLLATGFAAQTGNWSAIAQTSGSPWAPPINISGSPNWSVNPFITGDQAGQVHVVWVEASEAGGGETPDTIYYTTLADGNWSTPIDIIAAPIGARLLPDAFGIDLYGRLVLITHLNRGLSISFADSKAAGAAQAWRTTTLNDNNLVNVASLAIDADGGYHVAYASDSQQIQYLTATDAGETWSDSLVASVNDSSMAVTEPAIAAAADGTIFVSWTRTTEATNWGPVGVWFSRSLDGGSTWSEPAELVSGEGYGLSSLLLEPDRRLHVFWVGSLVAGGRYHQWSDDLGETWSPTLTIASPDQNRGYAGPVRPLLDSLGELSAVFPGLGAGNENIWYSRWDNGNWIPAIVVSSGLPNSQLADAVLTNGHLAHAVWIEYSSRDIWYSTSDTGAPATVSPPVRPLPSTSIATPSPISQTIQPELVATSTLSAVPFDSPQVAPSQNTNRALVLGTAPAALLVFTVVMMALLRQNRRR